MSDDGLKGAALLKMSDDGLKGADLLKA